jgi:single-stranded-DNA-specific exonuclease
MVSFLDQLCSYYGLSVDQYKQLIQPATRHDLVAFSSYPDHQRFLRVLYKHLDAHHRVLVYGDYDADGMFSSAILVDTLKTLNAKVSVYLPQRYQDGYGLSLKQAQRIIEEQYSLVICIDNGVSQQEAIALLKDHDIDVLVMDHHGIPETLPNFDALIHPEYQHPNPFPRCAASLALSFSLHIHPEGHDLHIIYAAIATMTDGMPLLKDNRHLVQLGVRLFNETLPTTLRPFAQQHPIDETTFSMTIGPIFNAIGRVMKDDTIQHVVPYLLAKEKDTLLDLSSTFIEINQHRKNLSAQWLSTWESNSAVRLIEEIDELSGLTGLIASRLLQKNREIVGIFAPDHQHSDQLIGSLRSPIGIDIRSIIAHYPGTLVAFGGHPQACGVTLKKEEYTRFKTYLLNIPIKFEKIEQPTLEIKTKDLTFIHYDQLQTFRPFGPGWQEPVFVIRPVPVHKLTYSKNPPYYLSTKLHTFADVFSYLLKKDDFENLETIELQGFLRLNSFHQQRKIQFFVTAYNSL